MLVLIELFGFRLPEPKTADLLLFIALLFVVVLVSIWAKYHATFRTFIRQTFTDTKGRPDAKLVTAFWFCGIITFLLLRGSFFKDNWPPIEILNSLLIFVSVLMGLDVSNSIVDTVTKRKNKAKQSDNLTDNNQ